ncbi:hypothetical protein A0128_02195 [Leptospira tipperaryensis]|uniref:Uncharacterized protein n=1 Tax=Leptospira tipperaryensis TaxID=2564040 RepID=A0A1D7UTC2_9LEPT|nr:hypothetical protein A0128_02195 [Leptospira tipperaryensis]
MPDFTLDRTSSPVQEKNTVKSVVVITTRKTDENFIFKNRRSQLVTIPNVNRIQKYERNS